MASSQTFSIKLTANGKEVEELQNALKEKAKEYEKQLDKINEKLKERDKLAEEEIKALEKESDSLTRKIKALGTAVEENITNLRKVDDVLKNLAGSSGSELGKALRGLGQKFKQVSDQTLKAGETMEQKLIEIKEKMAEVRHEMTKRDGVDAMKRAQATLQDLANTPLDKLKMGLDSIEKKLLTMSEAEKQAGDGMTLLQARSRYKAQIAVNEYGRAGTADLSKMNQDQLRAEQSRLRSAYMATEGAQGYEAVSKEYLDRLQQVNKLLNDIGKVDVTKVLRDMETSNATLEQMEQALKQINEEARNLKMNDDPGFKQYEENASKLKQEIEEVKAKMQGIANLDFDHLEDVSTEKLEAALKDIENQEKHLAEVDKSTAKILAQNKEKLRAQILKNKQAVQDYSHAEEVAKNTGKHNVAELKAAYETLQQKLMSLNTDQKRDIARTKEQMAKLKKEIDNLTSSVKAQSTIWQTAVRNITAYIGVFGAFNFIKNKVQQVFESNKQLSDSLANIRKVSGLTSGEINELYTNIAKIDTRNSVEQLNNLAYAGAKLGIQEHGGVSALTGFVRAAEQVQMALGEDLGEEALPALAKLTEVMGLMDMYGVEDAMQKASSAVFMLSTTSTSTGNEIIEFSKRLMGLANVSHISASELLALGSASSSMGLMAEVSSTAFNKVFTKIQSNTAAIEKAVGVAKGSLKSLVDEGKTMEAIVTVFDKMRDMSMEEMQRRGIFTALGSDGARLNNVMTTMADRVDMLKKHLDVANQSFEEGEAVIAEYMIQNQTAAAYMERAANAFEKAFTNPEGVDAVTNLAKQWHDFAIEMTNSTLMMGSLKAALIAILGVVKGLIVVLPVLIQFLLFKGSLAAITQIVTGFVNMSKAIWAAVTASKALTAAQKWNGITTALSIVAAAFMTIKSAMNQANEEAERARQQQQELDKAFASSKDVIDKSTQSLEEYKTALDKSNLSQDERDKRLRAYMKNEYQPYLDFLGIEIDKVEDLANAYAQVTFAIKQKAAAEEKENYRSRVNGDNRNERIAAQAEAIREAQKAGFKIDKKFLESNWEEGINTLYSRAVGNKKDAWIYLDDAKAAKHLDLYNALKAYQQRKGTETKIDNDVNRMFKSEYPDLDLENFSLEDFRKKQMEAQIQREKNRKATTVLPPTKDEIRDAKKAAQEAKEAARKELKDAETETNAIISKVEEWYTLQQGVITDAYNNGEITNLEMTNINQQLEAVKNQALAAARRSLSGQDTGMWEIFKAKMGDLMLDQSDWSKELLQSIIDTNMTGLRNALMKFDGKKSLEQWGFTSTAFRDALNKKAAQNESKVKEIAARFTKEAEKMMEQYKVIEVAEERMQRDLETMGFITETVEQMADRLQRGITKKPDTNLGIKSTQRTEIVGSFMGKYANAEPVSNTNDAEQLQQWLNDFTEQGKAKWAIGLPSISDWLKDANSHLPEIRQFYETLMEIQRTAQQREREGQSPTQTTEAQNAAFNYLLGKRITDQEAFKQMGMKFVGMGTIPYTIDITNQQEALQWVKQFATDAGGELEGWAQAFPKIAEWVGKIKEAEKDGTMGEAELESMKEVMPEIEALYLKLINYSDNVSANIKKQVAAMMPQRSAIGVDEMTAQHQQQVNLTSSLYDQQIQQANNTGNTDAAVQLEREKNQAIIELEYQFAEQMYQIQQQMGVNWGEELEHEIAMYQNMLDRQLISEQQFQQKKKQLQTTTGMKYAQYFNDQMKSLVDALQSYEIQATENKYDAQIQAAQAAGQDTAALEEEKEAAIYEIRRKYAAMDLAIKISEIGVNTALAIMNAYATLPYPAAIAANVMLVALGAAQTALAIAEYQKVMGSGASSSKSGAKANVKLASDMLTYDEGNVGQYVGNDGHVYRAREQESLPEGVSIVRQPIATTVNGQRALVGEKGPEIVIGRRTSRRIMMNEPRLLHSIMQLERGSGFYSGHRGMRLFDEGNLGDILGDKETGSQGVQDNGLDAETKAALQQLPATMDALSQMMGAFSQVMTSIQQQGIPAKLNRFGKDSLDEGMREVNAFRKRYPV